MNKKDFLELITSDEYDFLQNNKHLGDGIIMLGLGGSHAYGTNVATSDVDIRGIAMNKTEDLLLGRDFEQVSDSQTDTVIYSLRKIFKLLTNCNPNIVEILGLSDDQILITSDIWQKIKENEGLFLSKRCVATFGGYANAQLRRLETSSARETGQAQKEKYILGSIENSEEFFMNNYKRIPEDALKLYIDKSDKEDMDSEIYVNLNLQHYPMRDLVDIFNGYGSIVRDYDKIGARNSKAFVHNKIGKHMMHLVRLHYMVFDILEKGMVKTYRDEEHQILMDIRNGSLLESDGLTPSKQFYVLLSELDNRLKYDKQNTKLPDEPDYKAIDELFIQLAGKEPESKINIAALDDIDMER